VKFRTRSQKLLQLDVVIQNIKILAYTILNGLYNSFILIDDILCLRKVEWIVFRVDLFYY
jgi:hypothetical protein